MHEYTVIKKGQSIHPCIKIPDEFMDIDLEIKIRPLREKGNLLATLENLFRENDGVNPFEMIQSPIEWQNEVRDEWK